MCSHSSSSTPTGWRTISPNPSPSHLSRLNRPSIYSVHFKQFVFPMLTSANFLNFPQKLVFKMLKRYSVPSKRPQRQVFSSRMHELTIYRERTIKDCYIMITTKKKKKVAQSWFRRRLLDSWTMQHVIMTGPKTLVRAEEEDFEQ